MELPAEIAARLLPPVGKKDKNLTAQLSLVPEGLTGMEQAVFKLLSTDTALHIDALAEASELSVSELSKALLSLEMRDLVRQLPGKCFVRRL